MAYTVMYNRSSVHISGITERTPVSRDGMTYSLSACPALSRHTPMMEDETFDDLTAAVSKAKINASVYGRKVCKHCLAAATAAQTI
jgi:hypothetical protein